jgi:hypothetical protein
VDFKNPKLQHKTQITNLEYRSILVPIIITMAAASSQPPPVAHAIGGSLGSALALLLFYPLERARIELQSEVLRPKKEYPGLESVEAEVETPNDIMPQPLLATPTSESSWMALPREEEKGENEPQNNTKNDEMSTSWSIDSSSESSALALTSPKKKKKKKKETLLQCLVQLHERGELYTGVSPVASTILTSQFVFFYMHAVLKVILGQSVRGSKKNSAALSLVSSCLAGLGNVILTNPLWVVNMAIVTGETKTGNLWRELYAMVKERGLKYMWNGTSASILLVSNPVIQFFCYEQMKLSRLVAPQKTVLLPIEAFFLGAMAKGVATLTT